MCGRAEGSFDGSPDYIEMETGQYTHHLNSGIGYADVLFLAHFGALPIFEVKEFDEISKESLYYQDLSKKRP